MLPRGCNVTPKAAKGRGGGGVPPPLRTCLSHIGDWSNPRSVSDNVESWVHALSRIQQTRVGLWSDPKTLRSTVSEAWLMLEP